jgi:hypothetical protein
VFRRGEGEGELRKVQGFRKRRKGACDAGRLIPSADAGGDPQRKGRGQPGRPPARGTRTIRMCSFDARIRGSTRPPPKEIDKRDWENREGSLLISRARATRTLRRCSLDVRSRRPSRLPSVERKRASLEGTIYMGKRWSLNARNEGQSVDSPGEAESSQVMSEGLAQQPQSKAPHGLAWLVLKWSGE